MTYRDDNQRFSNHWHPKIHDDDEDEEEESVFDKQNADYIKVANGSNLS